MRPPVLIVFLALTLVKCPPGIEGSRRLDFSAYHRIHPVYHHHHRPSRAKRSAHYENEVLSVYFQVPSGERVTLDLLLNTAPPPFQKIQINNSYVVNTPPPENCYYTGKVRGRPSSRVAISNCEGVLSGLIDDGQDLIHVQDNYLYKDKDRVSIGACGFPDTKRVKRHIQRNSTRSFSKEEGNSVDNDVEAVRKPWKANKNSRYVELILVVDNMEYVNHDRSLSKVYRECKDIVNVMNALYSPLNIYIALVGVVVWTEYDEITLDTKGDKTLSHFLHYRRERLVKDHPNDNAQLLTGIEFEGGVVGKALKGPICTYKFSGGVNMWHSNVISLVATTVAHELGHNFGMEHDDEDCSCPDERCIMAPASSKMKPSFWSSCSLNSLALAFEQGMDYCLRNKPEKLFGGPVCGNGFVEEGEECDCGLKHHCDTTCCNPDTCTLTPGSLCATGECCDLSKCKPKAAGSICRKQDRECDLSEYCSGESEFCPRDIHKADGTTCKAGHAFCFNGSCRTHTDQCKLLWGPTGEKSDDQCYELNTQGSRKGNCGYLRANDSYVQCKNADVRCGMLHCLHYNEKLEFGMEKLSILSHSFINSDGEIIPCRTAIVDLGTNDMDPGLAPEGSRCDNDSLCVNQKCMLVSSLPIGPNSCNCNGNGVCNSQGHCHCLEGYAPPDCLSPGLGGSLDSGPAGLILTEEVESNNTLAICLSLALIPLLYICIYGLVVAFKCRREERRTGGSHRKNLTSFKLEGLFGHGNSKKDEPDHGNGLDPERYDKMVISGPTLVSATTNDSNSNSAESFSPTHALLPPPNGGKRKNTDTPNGHSTEVTVVTSDARGGGFLSNFNMSIKSLSNENRLKKFLSRSNFNPGGGGSDLPKYQIKVEKRVSGGLDAQDDPVLSPVPSSIEEEEEESEETPPPSYSESVGGTSSDHTFPKSKTLPPIHVNYANNPKLAFPHSSSFEAALAKQKPVSTKSNPSHHNLIKKLSPGSPEPLISPPGAKGGGGVIKRPLISKPVLKTATPTAESLISKAPSTGVSQSSILAIKREQLSPASEGDKRSSRGVVFCDPLTLPSPTNPNTPAIIHQPKEENNPQHLSPAPLASPEKISSHELKKPVLPKKPGPPPPPRANEVGGRLIISSPFLKSQDRKAPTPPAEQNNKFNAPRKAIPASSSSPMGGRPSSLGNGSRPSVPPPPRPQSERAELLTPSVDLSPIFKPSHPSPDDNLSTSSSNEGGDLLREILMDADKKAEAETGETELYSTLMRKKKAKKKLSS